MTPNDIAGWAGAFLVGGAGAGAVFYKIALPWFKQRDHDVASIKTEVGVGTSGPSLLSLVASTSTQVATVAATVGRLETHSEESRKSAADVLTVLKRHGERLEDHGRRLGIIEQRHDTCGFTSERVAELLALKTEDVARLLSVETKAVAAKLAAKTEKTADDLAHHVPVPKGGS